MRFISLSKHGQPRLHNALQRLTLEKRYTNVFNPSLALVGGIWHLTFRAETFVGEKPFRSFYTQLAGDHFAEPLDLSELLREKGLPQVADPKLVKLGDELFFTFNTGNLGKINNAIFLMKIWPSLGIPQECEIAERQTVEKNWAFYLHQGQLAAIYSLSPIVRLQLASGTLGTNEILHFERTDNASGGSDISQSISIGSQLSFATPELAYMVVHEKPRIRGRRGYVGKLARLEFGSDGKIAVTVSKTWLLHSIRKMLHFGKRHNPNLLWAFYFSGLAVEGEKLTFGFGINDIEFCFSEVQLDQIWP